jgi:hypothetical protein
MARNYGAVTTDFAIREMDGGALQTFVQEEERLVGMKGKGKESKPSLAEQKQKKRAQTVHGHPAACQRSAESNLGEAPLPTNPDDSIGHDDASRRCGVQVPERRGEVGIRRRG